MPAPVLCEAAALRLVLRMEGRGRTMALRDWASWVSFLGVELACAAELGSMPLRQDLQ